MVFHILLPLPPLFETGSFNVDTVASAVAIAIAVAVAQKGRRRRR